MLKFRKNIKIGITLLCLGFLFTCTEEEEQAFLTDMAAFDQSYIPVLYYVRQNQLEEASLHVSNLEQAWQKLANEYQGRYPENEDWQEAFRMTKLWLDDSYAAIESDRSIEAFNYLDHVRYQFVELRYQLGFEYYLDRVWDVESSLDLVEEVAVDKMLCLLEYCEFEEMVVDLNKAWYEAKKVNPDRHIFDFSNNHFTVVQKKKELFQMALSDFNIAVAAAQHEELAVSIALLRDAYHDYLVCFGDFSIKQSEYTVFQ